MNMLSTEQLNFNNIPSNNANNFNSMPPFNSIKNNQYYLSQADYMSPQYLGDIKPNMMNNSIMISNKDNNDTYNVQVMNNSTENIINNTKDNNIINNLNNTNNNKDDKGENIVEDPDENLFRQIDNKEKENSKKDDESELSDDSEKKSDDERDYNDHLLAQYERVKRVKNKWKVILKGCIVQKDNTEYICGKIHGELEREW